MEEVVDGGSGTDRSAVLAPGVQRYYAEWADALAERYEELTFESVHAEILHLLPIPPARAVDIGAGTGRDAAALARLGHQVVAVEPVREMRQAAARLHPEPITWVADALPALAGLTGKFDLILLSAVWMHLDAGERTEAMSRLSGLLADGGRLAVTLRHGSPPQDRRMFDVPAAETVRQAEEQGLRLLLRGGGEDRLGRDGVSWSHLVFEKIEGAHGG
ncbi:class I SAM-dependent methyltransferase [Streptomyces sp. NPDC055243]|uniref:class I SAM-dependent methyltransferase n=1 Tax=Streptomyces sp. NPDC055243 TaxID=3365720 RepID=UPI0037D87C32